MVTLTGVTGPTLEVKPDVKIYATRPRGAGRRSQWSTANLISWIKPPNYPALAIMGMFLTLLERFKLQI